VRAGDLLPLSVVCPTCGAGEGAGCRALSGSRPVRIHKGSDGRLYGCHTSRLRAAPTWPLQEPVLPSAPMPAGRPPADKVANVAADTTINIRVTSQRKEALTAKAQRAGFKSLSAWLLHLGEAAPDAVEDHPRRE
jgi:hypothetical protein